MASCGPYANGQDWGEEDAPFIGARPPHEHFWEPCSIVCIPAIRAAAQRPAYAIHRGVACDGCGTVVDLDCGEDDPRGT